MQCRPMIFTRREDLPLTLMCCLYANFGGPTGPALGDVVLNEVSDDKVFIPVLGFLNEKCTPKALIFHTFLKKFEETKTQCIHIHCPEGATPKDGPSAGTAITTVIYSLLNNKNIIHNLAITGEINLQGKVTEIGGLDLKILGGIAAGVKIFLFPQENVQDFDKFMEKHGHKDIVKDISFYPISTIEEALKFAIE